MPKHRSTHLAQPVFGEPTFSEDAVTPDPSGFTKLHSSDTDTYKQIQDLLKKDVVGFAKRFDLVTIELNSHTMVAN
jgi:hypothetical protein